MESNSIALGDLIETVYDEFLAAYGDGELAAIATATVINDLLASEEFASDNSASEFVC